MWAGRAGLGCRCGRTARCARAAGSSWSWRFLSFVSARISFARGGRGGHAVPGRDVVDRRGEEVRVFPGGQVTAGEDQDLGAGHSLAGGRDLPMLVGVLLAAAHVEGNRAVKVAGDRGEVPPLRVAAVLADESGGVVREPRSVPAADRSPQLS